MTQVIEQEQMDLLVNAIKEKKIVAFPTETVYGVACLFNDLESLDRIMEIKNRNPNKAVTLMLSHKDDVKKYGFVDEGTQRVIDKFMPGKMTIVLKRLESVDPRNVSGKDTIGIRIPDSSFVLFLIDQTGPLSVTSANLSGHENTTNEKEVLAQLDGRIDMVVKGQTTSATASTVVDLSHGDVRILRNGVITKEEIEEVYYENCSRL